MIDRVWLKFISSSVCVARCEMKIRTHTQLVRVMECMVEATYLLIFDLSELLIL